MDRMTASIFMLALLLLGSSALAQKHADAVKQGNEAFRQKDYQTALEQYHIAEADRPESPEINYNIGNTLFEQGDFEQATEHLNKSLNTQEAGLAARAQYNLGNTHFRKGDYQSAIQAYKESLELNPDDMDAKYNLEVARRMLKEQSEQEQQQQQDQEEQEQEQQEQQEQEQQQQQDQQEQDQQQQQQQEQNAEQDENQQREQQQQPQPQDQEQMSKEDAERILNALKDDEQEIQKRIRRNKQATGYIGKDW